MIMSHSPRLIDCKIGNQILSSNKSCFLSSSVSTSLNVNDTLSVFARASAASLMVPRRCLPEKRYKILSALESLSTCSVVVQGVHGINWSVEAAGSSTGAGVGGVHFVVHELVLSSVVQGTSSSNGSFSLSSVPSQPCVIWS